MFFKSAPWAILALFAILLTLSPAKAQDCAQERFEGARYTVCTIDPATSDLRLFWKNAEDEPYRTFSNLADALGEEEQRLVFAINAGMYQSDFSPVGLYVENGEELRPADTTTIEGRPAQIPNFYKKPNGVFFLGETGAGILPTDAFLETQPDARFATQSGPMLVIDDQLHPALIPGSTDRTRRSGVGVCENGQVRFAISDGDVNFHDFARLFRDQLACPNALFLDGGRGAGLYLPQMNRNDFSWHGGYGPIFGLLE
ncbi:phosphodiester glycosidase family protein [Pelagibacterium mangrovi]|uniref:phosphodiester glycosidase family protein n=1 Tax=Pelagibacterium mangrovi TaxID=3119828 RepID=UPI003F8093B8